MLNSRLGVVLVPDNTARIQNLGPFRSGELYETDILDQSALIAFEERPGVPQTRDDLVNFAFEGNSVGAVNLNEFHEKLVCAAGRLATRAPSIAYGVAYSQNVTPVARFDIHRMVFHDILDAALLESWSGTKLSDYLPISPTQPTNDPKDVAYFCGFPMTPINASGSGPFLWQLLDGTLLSKKSASPADLVEIWPAGDPGLPAVLSQYPFDDDKIALLASRAPDNTLDNATGLKIGPPGP